MSSKPKTTKKSKKSLRSTSRWRDPDDAPLITKAMLDRAEVRDGNKEFDPPTEGKTQVGSRVSMPICTESCGDAPCRSTPYPCARFVLRN